MNLLESVMNSWVVAATPVSRREPAHIISAWYRPGPVQTAASIQAIVIHGVQLKFALRGGRFGLKDRFGRVESGASEALLAQRSSGAAPVPPSKRYA